MQGGKRQKEEEEERRQEGGLRAFGVGGQQRRG